MRFFLAVNVECVTIILCDWTLLTFSLLVLADNLVHTMGADQSTINIEVPSHGTSMTKDEDMLIESCAANPTKNSHVMGALYSLHLIEHMEKCLTTVYQPSTAFPSRRSCLDGGFRKMHTLVDIAIPMLRR